METRSHLRINRSCQSERRIRRDGIFWVGLTRCLVSIARDPEVAEGIKVICQALVQLGVQVGKPVVRNCCRRFLSILAKVLYDVQGLGCFGFCKHAAVWACSLGDLAQHLLLIRYPLVFYFRS